MTIHLSLGELLSAMPHVLGDPPHECVVALSVNANGFPTCAFVVERAVLLDPDRSAVTAATVAEELAEEGSQLAVLASYTSADVRRSCPALEALALEVEFAVPHVEAVVVTGEGWFRPGCMDSECCPPSGRPLPPVPAQVPRILADARRRAERPHHVAASALARASEREAAARMWEAALVAGEVSDAAMARHLATTLDDLCVRDWVVLSILGADEGAAIDALWGRESGSVAQALDGALLGTLSPERDGLERARRVVDRVARAARGKRRRAATRTLSGVIAWWEGNLDAARARCDEALACDDGYRLAELVRLAAARGIAPGWVSDSPQTGR